MLKKIMLFAIPLLLVVFSGCEEDCDTGTQPDITPSTVLITYPFNRSTVYEIAIITCMAADNLGIKKVTLWVDGYQIHGAEDSSEPYELYWNTVGYEDKSSHMIVVRAFDNENYITDSDPIILFIDNTYAYPLQVNIRSIIFQDNTFVIDWYRSRDTDFHMYTLYEDFDRSMSSKAEIYSSTNVNDTTYVVENIAVNERRFYQISVSDTLGFETLSQVFTGTSYDLVAYYPFNGNANDEGGNDLHGTVKGANLTEDRHGNVDKAYYFDGNYDIIDLRQYRELCIAEDLTISLWS